MQKLSHSEIRIFENKEIIEIFENFYRVDEFINFLYFYKEDKYFLEIHFEDNFIMFANECIQVHFKLEKIN
jgi:hypothetical protein